MKKFVVTLFLLVGIFLATTAFANPTYNMFTSQAGLVGDPSTAYAGRFYVNNSNGLAVNKMNADLPVGPLTWYGASIPPDFGGNPASFNAAGWWEFGVTSSTADQPPEFNWNTVFASGTYRFDIAWNGQVFLPNSTAITMPTAAFNVTNTFANVFGQWYQNNPSVYTYLGFYIDPTKGPASTPGTQPVGIFAFVAAEPGANFDIDLRGIESDYYVSLNGTGVMTASVPEPATMLLLGLGLMGVAGIRRKFKG